MDTSTETQRRRYPGSRPFSKNDEWVFFGRDSDIEELITKINVEKTIVLYGKSGLGKTSLLNAGVLTRLEKPYLIVPLRFGTPAPGDIKHPLDILDQQLAELFNGESFLNNIEPEDISLWQHIKNLQISNPDHMTLLLVFDQFEELFTYSQGVDEFAQALAEVLYNQMPKNFQRALRLVENMPATRLSNEQLELLERPIDAKVLMAIRSDRMGLLDRLSFLIPNILKSCYELKHLSRAQAQDAIALPAQRESQFQSEPFAYQPEALAKMLAYLTQNGETPVESFQLQILCQYVEENFVIRQKKTSVGPEDLGDLETIYHDFYDRTRRSLGTEEDQRKARLLIEEGLIFEKEKRRISLFEGQIKSTYDIGPDLLRKIVNTHIIRREHRGGGYIYELSHDSLVAPILRAKKQRMVKEEKRKQEEERRKEKEKRRKEEEKKQKEKEERLKLQLAEQKAEFEYQRAEQEAASAKRMRRLSITLGVLVLIVVVTAISTLLLKQKLEVSQKKLKAEELVRQGEKLASEMKLDDAVLKFEDAVALNPGLDLDPQAKAKELVEDAKKLKAQGLVREGQELAQRGDWNKAIAKFEGAKTQNPDLGLDPNKATAKILVSNGQKFAEDREVEDAIEQFKNAVNLDPSLQINPDTLAKAIAASSFVRQGEKLARDGNIKLAVERFNEAKKLMPGLDLDPEPRARKLYAEALVLKGDNLARQGKIDDAVESFNEAKKLMPDLDLNPELRARKLLLVFKGENSARSGDIDGAKAQFNEAQNFYPDLEITAKSWNVLCWNGSLWEKADLVMTACKKAVSMDSINGAYRDSRGLARALSGDYKGAIEDFNYYVKWAQENNRPENIIQERKDWIQKIEKTHSPFDQEVLKALRK